MASYDSDFFMAILPRKELIETWAEYLFKNMHLECNESGYEFNVLLNGIASSNYGVDGYIDVSDIELEAKEMANILQKNKIEEQNKVNQEKNAKEILKNRNIELAELARLKRIYG